jgi:hypothetical protein
MTYQVVFDVAEHGYRTWWFTLPGALFIAIGGVLPAYARRKLTVRDRRAAPVAALLLVVVGLTWIIDIYEGTHREYLQLVNGLRTSQFTTVEGRVTDFVPEGSDGHPSEHWSVRGHRYQISPATVTSAFNAPGIIRSGDSVRIAEVGGAIARLEVMR